MTIFGSGVTHTLTAEGHDASEDGTGRGTPIVAATLTGGAHRPGVSAPGRREEDDKNLVLVGDRHPVPVASAWDPAPDGRRTSACGNGVAAPVAEWIAGRIIDHLQEGRLAA